jgi:hypothetical protein
MSDTRMGTKVRALLDTADSYRAEGNHEAAALYQGKAEALMVKYRIEQEETIAKDPQSAKPIQVDIDLCGFGSKYRTQYHHMWYYIAQHTGVREYVEYVYTDGGTIMRAHVVGYEEDIRYAEMLFTSARLVFMEKLEPKIDRSLSDQVNVYRLRSAGIERVRIAEMMWDNADKLFLGRVGRLYKAECEERGEEALLSGRGVTGKAYREQYAEQFVSTLRMRLFYARQAAEASGGGLVLHGRNERLKEAFYTFYPNQRPKAALPTGTNEAPECERCAANKSGSCKEHPRTASARMPKGIDPYSIAAQRGRMAGDAAARNVALNRNGGRGELGS